MNIKLVTVGKIKEKYLRQGIDEYSKRLSRYGKLTMVEVKDEMTPDNLSDREAELIKKKEGDRILSHLDLSSYVIALEIGGKNLSSEELAEKMEELMVEGRSDVIFIIGGSLGLSEDVLARSDYKLSFSKMTFPHQLMKMILLEQVYRAFRIIRNEPYHK